MDMKELRYFRAIAETGTISKAAAVLRIAQPALSRHIQKLEHSLGVELLQRTPKGVIPTAAGRRLLARTEYLESTLTDILREVSTYAHEVQGPLRVGVQNTLSERIMPEIIRDLLAEHSKIKLHVVAGQSTEMLDSLLDEALDVAITDTPSHAPRELDVLPLWSEAVHLIGARSQIASELFRNGPVSLNDVAALPLILPSRRYAIRQTIDLAVALANLPALTPLLEVDGLRMIHSLVSSGVGFTLLPPLGTRGPLDPRSFAIVGITPDLRRHVSVVTRVVVRNETKVKTFIRFFRRAMRDVVEKDPFGTLRMEPFVQGHMGTPVLKPDVATEAPVPGVQREHRYDLVGRAWSIGR